MRRARPRTEWTRTPSFTQAHEKGLREARHTQARVPLQAHNAMEGGGAHPREEVAQSGEEQLQGDEIPPPANQETAALDGQVASPRPRLRGGFKPCYCDGGDKCQVHDHAAPSEEDPNPCKRNAGDRKTCQPCRKGRNRKRKKTDDESGKDVSPANPGGKRAPLAAAADTLTRLCEGAGDPGDARGHTPRPSE